MPRKLKLLLALLMSTLLSACAPGVVRHNNAGNEHFAANDYDEALGEYRQAQVEEPDRAEPYYNAANAYNRQSQPDAALAQTQQALKTADPELAARAWYNLGNSHFDAAQWPQAVAAYQEALRLTPDDLDAKHNLELALQKLEEQEQQEQEQQEQEQQEQEQQEQEQQEQEQQEQEQQENQQDKESESDAQSQAGEATPTPASPSQAQSQPAEEGMTPEQALQLLQALVGDSETLQERLQEIYRVPQPPPEQDW
jgi:Ca-activated chloride channel family protein